MCVCSRKVYFSLYTLQWVYGSAGYACGRAGIVIFALQWNVWTLGLQMSVRQDISVRGMGWMAVDTHEERDVTRLLEARS